MVFQVSVEIKKILFVCSVNKQRSKTAEDYFSKGHSNLEFKSAGTNIKVCQKEGTNPLTEESMKWASLVFVMERKHQELIQKHTGSTYKSKIRVLNIPDRYKYYDKGLIEILDSKIKFQSKTK